jgi:DNA-binding NarL/FixJ family response regulator
MPMMASAEQVGFSGTFRTVRLLHPDVVIMDVSMPRMNGDEATMREAGAAVYLTKGGPSADLVAAIRRLGAGDGRR